MSPITAIIITKRTMMKTTIYLNPSEKILNNSILYFVTKVIPSKTNKLIIARMTVNVGACLGKK